MAYIYIRGINISHKINVNLQMSVKC